MKTILNKLSHLPLGLAISGIALLILLGCDDFVEVGLPPSQLTSANVFRDKAGAEAAMANVYAKIRDQGLLTGSNEGMTHQLGNYTDELRFYGSGTNMSALFYNNSLLPATRNVLDWWRYTYNHIYSVNALLEGVSASPSISQADKDLLTGEAYFIRALLHHYLAGIYGDVPYITSTDYKANSTVHRIPVADVYEMAQADLERAIELLPETYITNFRVRPNRGAAKALLARIHLQQSRWAEAANMASAVINDAQYVWEPDLNKVFLKESTATIFQLMPALAGNNTLEAILFTFNSGPPAQSALSQGLVDAFENGDLRRVHWVTTVNGTGGPWYRASKYKSAANTGVSKEFSVVFRLAEMYLIRAEARARQGELVNAQDDLNFIRNNAGLADSEAATGTDLLNAILQERRVELFTEYGHRFFDLKRYNMLNSALAIKPGWNPEDALLPIPESELLLNRNLEPQNPGY